MKNGVILRLLVSSAVLAWLSGCAGTISHCGHDHDLEAVGGGVGCGMDSFLESDVKRLLATPRPWLPDGPAPGEDGMAPFAACFDPDSPPTAEVIALVNTTIRGSLAKYNAVDRWTTTSVNGGNIPSGTPITLRVSFLPDGVNAPDLNGVQGASTLFATMDQKFDNNRALWKSKIQQAFTRWGTLTGVTYIFVSAPGVDWDDGAAWGTSGGSTRGDVRIAMRAMDGAAGVLAFNSYPNNGDMVLDSAENWASISNDYRFLRNVIAHEHGHGLGLAHVCPGNRTKLMEPLLATQFDGPQQDDLRGAHFRYGDVNEPNNSASAATVVSASVTPSQTFTVGSVPVPAISQGSLVSLGINGDVDWYRFDATAPMLVSATATPLGTTYDSADQVGTSCPTGSPVNAIEQADIAVEVLSSSSVSLSAASGNGRGLAETVSGVLVPGGAPFYVRVFETSTQTESQMYRLTVSTSAVTTLSASNGTFFEGVELSWNAVPGVTTYSLWRSTSTNRGAAVLAVTSGGTSVLDGTVEPGQTYYYWLRVSQGANPGIDVAGPVTGAASPCRVDLGKQGGVAGFDNLLDSNDFIVFIDFFFDSDQRADFGVQGGLAGSDGQFDSNDFIAFIDSFFTGCGS